MEVTHEGGQGDNGGAAEVAAGEGGAGGLDLGPLQQHVEKLGQDLGQRLDGLEQRLPQPEDPYSRNDLGQFAGLDPQDPYQQQQGLQGGQLPPEQMYGPDGELTPEAAQQQLAQMVNPMLAPLQQQNQQLAQQTAQLQQMMQELEMDRGAEQLESKYPELREQEKADSLVASAAQMAQQIGSPDLVGRTGFLELVLKAQRADAAAASETAATPGPALESAGGASLAGGEDTPQQRIKAAGGRHPVFGVWGQ